MAIFHHLRDFQRAASVDCNDFTSPEARRGELIADWTLSPDGRLARLWRTTPCGASEPAPGWAGGR